MGCRNKVEEKIVECHNDAGTGFDHVAFSLCLGGLVVQLVRMLFT